MGQVYTSPSPAETMFVGEIESWYLGLSTSSTVLATMRL